MDGNQARGSGMDGNQSRGISMKKVLKSLQRDVLSKPRRFFSPDRNRNRQKHRKEDQGARSSPQSRVQWREPSPRTCALLQEIYNKLFTEEHELNIDFIEKTLTLCPPDEDILVAEDRDHYNMIHKVGHNSEDRDHYNMILNVGHNSEDRDHYGMLHKVGHNSEDQDIYNMIHKVGHNSEDRDH